MTKYKDHPLAEIFPLMTLAEIEILAEDIKQNGLRAPITLLDGKILDGRNRYRACEIAEVEPKTREHAGDDALSFVISANLHRRHLNESQRAMVAAEIANLGEGQPSKKNSANLLSTPVSQSEAAEKLHVSTRSVTAAKKVQEKCSKSTVKAVKAGEKSVAAAVKEIDEKEEKKKEHIDKTGYPIPEEMLEDWQRAEQAAEMISRISAVKCTLDAGLADGDVIFAEINNGTVSKLKDVYGDLKRILPHAVCTACSGHNRKKCTLCKRRGWLSDFLYKTAIPEETKSIRAKACKK